MNITTYNGDFSFDLTQIENIIELFCNAKGQPYDEIWISGEEEYPSLCVLINGDYANVHFFMDDMGDVWQAVGDNEEDMEFMVDGQMQSIEGDYIISFEKMLEAVREFCSSSEKPKCLEWEEMWE